MCSGTELGINPQYLDLAKKTGGSVHTLEQDMSDLTKTREGEIITISGINYKIENGKFKKLK